MQFNSYIFILAFMPTILLLYFGLGKINKLVGKMIIIFGSVIFYAYAGITTLKVLCISLVINFLFVKLIDKKCWKKLYMIIPIIINVGILLYFKYTKA